MWYWNVKIFYMGSGCGTVGRAVASDPEICGSNPVIGKFYLVSTELKLLQNKQNILYYWFLVDRNVSKNWKQCDQTAILLFDVRPFTTMTICPEA